MNHKVIDFIYLQKLSKVYFGTISAKPLQRELICAEMSEVIQNRYPWLLGLKFLDTADSLISYCQSTVLARLKVKKLTLEDQNIIVVFDPAEKTAELRIIDSGLFDRQFHLSFCKESSKYISSSVYYRNYDFVKGSIPKQKSGIEIDEFIRRIKPGRYQVKISYGMAKKQENIVSKVTKYSITNEKNE